MLSGIEGGDVRMSLQVGGGSGKSRWKWTGSGGFCSSADKSVSLLGVG